MQSTTDALGRVIGQRRRAMLPKLSQTQLGEDAGYGKGAGVSISRIENGQSRPSPDKLARIAEVLGVGSDVLEQDAIHFDEARARRGSGATKDDRSLKQRVEDVQRTVEERTIKITALADAFNAAHDRARDKFFLPFVEAGGQIEDVPASAEPTDPAEEPTDPAEEPTSSAAYRLNISVTGVGKALASLRGAAAGTAVGGAAAYGAFTAVAAFGTASTDVAISGLAGAAGTSAGSAWFGGGALAASGAGIAGGALVLAAIVAAPVAVFAVGGFIWMARRSKQKDAELLAEVESAELKIELSQPGFDALCGVLPEATQILDDVAVHGGRAHKRWADQLGALPVQWSALNSDQQRRYLDFVTIAACQLTAANINAGAFLAAQGVELKRIVDNTMQDLEQARLKIDALI